MITMAPLNPNGREVPKDRAHLKELRRPKIGGVKSFTFKRKRKARWRSNLGG